MYATGVLFIDYKWNLPLKHRQFGGLFVFALTTVFFLLNRKGITKVLRTHLKLKGGSLNFKLFKLSVVFMFAHFVLSAATGLMMIAGANLYNYHKLS